MTNTRGGASSSSSFSPPSALKSTTAEATAAGERMESVKKMAASKTAAEKLSQMRKKMEECNVDGKDQVIERVCVCMQLASLFVKLSPYVSPSDGTTVLLLLSDQKYNIKST